MDLKLFILFLALVKFTISNPFDPPLKLGKFQSKDIDFEDTYRLPNNSLPLSYDLWLETHVGAEDEDYEFQGKVKIAIEITNSTDVITLHYRKINITKVDQLDFADSTTKVKENLELSYDIVKEFLRIKLDKIHTGGEKIVLDIIYNGELRYDDSGFYRSKYQDVNNKTIWYATTQFEMTDARHCMPCYDEPGIRAPISLKIHHSSKYNAISNTPILSRVASGKTGYDLTTFETTPKMQTYLLAFLISDFDYKSNNNTRVEQRVYATPQAIKDGEADFAVGVVDSILKGLESHLGIDYPLKKMDHAAITDFRFGAMENFGLITYIDRGLLWRSKTDAETNKKDVITLISHEYTHQFFGNIVSPKWWSYTWLNEGFATLFANVIPSKIYPNEDYIYRFHVGAQRAAFNFDRLNKSVPMNFYVETPEDIENKFDTISYSKAGSVLRMFQQAIGESIFAKGLEYYLAEMYYSAATPQDLHRNLQKALNEANPGNSINVEERMSSWETQAGYPIIYITNLRGKNIFTLIQMSSTGGNQIYDIPITYITHSNMEAKKEPKFWMTSREYDLTLKETDKWLIMNLWHDGYYKVVYSNTIWKEMMQSFYGHYEKIPLMNRVFIYDEIPWNIIESISGIDLMETLTKETESIIWLRVKRIENLLGYYFVGSELSEKFDEFILSKVQIHINRLGYDVKPGESYKDSDMRNSVIELNCKHNNATCLLNLFEKFKKDPKSISSEEQICYAFRSMDVESFNALNFNENDKKLFTPYFTCSLSASFLEQIAFPIFLQKPASDPKEQINVFKMIRFAMMNEFTANKMLDFFIAEVVSETLPKIRSIFFILNAIVLHPINNEETAWRVKRLSGASFGRDFLPEDQHRVFLFYAFNKVKWLENNPEISYYFNPQDTTTSPTTDDSFSLVSSKLLILFMSFIMKIFIQ